MENFDDQMTASDRGVSMGRKNMTVTRSEVLGSGLRW